MSVAIDRGTLPSSARSSIRLRPLSTEQSLTRVHDLLAHPVDSGAWWTMVAARLDDLDDAMWEELALAGGPAGLHQEILDQEPRFAFRVRRLEREHVDLIGDLAELRRLVSSCMGRTDGVSTVLGAATDLVGRIQEHGRRSGTLVHEAYQRDLGGGD